MSSVYAIKEQAQSLVPLLLYVVKLVDGTTLRLSSHDVTPVVSGMPESGNAFVGRIMSQDIPGWQSMSPEGIDYPSQISITVSDADNAYWLNYESLIGFAGATMTVYQIAWDCASTFSDDYLTRFMGICGSPQNWSDTSFTLPAATKLNMQRTMLPQIPVQKRCPWEFPSTAPQRQDGADNPDSIFFRCGYSPDASGGNARGNGSFTTCNRTKTDCVARGMYTVDSLARTTGRFGGIQFDPPATWRSKSYTEGKTIEGVNSSNEAKYRQWVPVVYGTSFSDPIPCNWLGDGNSSRGEFILTSGYVQTVYKVIVNDVLIPDNNPPNKAPDPLFRWNWVNQGTRNGAPCTDALFDSKGDPYGNFATIEVVVPRKLADSSSIPRVRVLFRGPSVRVYTNSTTYTDTYSDNPVWTILDLLVRAGWQYSQIDIASFVTAAAVCDGMITYIDLSGGTSTHKRYSTSLSISQRMSAAELIRGIRESCKAMLVPSGSGPGLLQIFIKQTIAAQQPSTVSGSNTNTTVNGGYPAYAFDESNIKLGSLKISTRSVSDSYNVRTGTFQDNENDYVTDSYRVGDSVAINRFGQEISTQYQPMGANSYDQILRCVETDAAEAYRGNDRGDSGGTYIVEFEASQRVSHLKAGHIVSLAWQTRAWTSSGLFRVMQIKPTDNFESARLVVQKHNDAWYADTYGQAGSPIYSASGKQQLARMPWGWQPNYAPHLASDPMGDPNETSFNIAQFYETAGDGTAIAKLQISGLLPVNKLSSTPAPLVAFQGLSTNTGGLITGGSVVYAVVCGVDSNGLLTAPSQHCIIAIPSGTNTNTATIPITSWPAGTVGYYCFAGYNPNMLTFQASNGASTPANITVGQTFFNSRAYGVPDVMFDHMRVRVKRIIHNGVWAQGVSAVTTNTLKISGASFTTNQFAGYAVTLLGRINTTGIVYWYSFNIASNTADTLTISGGDDLTTIFAVGDVVVCRTKPSTFTSTTIGDANFDNCFGPGGLTSNAEAGYLIRIIEGTGRGQVRKIISNTSTVYTVDRAWDLTPDSTSRFIVEDPAWQIDLPSQTFQNQYPTDARNGKFLYDVNVDNYNGLVLLAMVWTVDSAGNESWEPDNPFREIYVFGKGVAPGSVKDGYYTDMPDGSNNVHIDIANGLNHRIVLSATAITIKVPVFTGGSISAGDVLYIYLDQDATGGRAVPSWDTGITGGFTTEVASQQIDGTASTRTLYALTYHPDQRWGLDQFRTGGAIT